MVRTLSGGDSALLPNEPKTLSNIERILSQGAARPEDWSGPLTFGCPLVRRRSLFPSDGPVPESDGSEE